MAKRWTLDEQQWLITLVSIYGTDWDAIAAQMGKTPKAVSSAYYRLMAKFSGPGTVRIVAPSANEALGIAGDFGGPIELTPKSITVRKGKDSTAVSLSLKNDGEWGYLRWRKIFDDFLTDLRAKAKPRKIARSWPTGKKSGLMAELAPFDAHIGKLIWGTGVGDKSQDYDVAIASRRYVHSVTSMLERVAPYKPERIYFIVGNDFFNINSQEFSTANGTPQKTEDSRIHRTWRMAKDAIVQSIDSCLELAPTEVIFVPGNHERERLFYFGEMVAALYSRTPGVSIDNAPAVRKYIRWGQVLIMLTHGKEEKIDTLPLIMAAERRHDWGQTKYHEAHVGHFHRKRAWKYMPLEEIGGVIVRALPSLTNTDEWHYLKGYVGNVKASEALLFHKTHGPYAVFTVTV